MQSLEHTLTELFKQNPVESGDLWVISLSESQWAMRKSLMVELNKQNITFDLKAQKLMISRTAILQEFKVPECTDEQMKSLLLGSVNLSKFFKAYPEPVHLADIGDFIEELSLRGLTFDFNDVLNSDSVLGIDAEDRVKFIQANKFYFEEDLKGLIDALNKKAPEPEILAFIQQKIKPKIIMNQKVKNSDFEHYSHMIDYFRSDKFNAEMGLSNLYGATLSSVEEKVRKWSQVKPNSVMDDPQGNIPVYEIDNYMWYQLTSEKALDYESFIMGHCVGQGSYDNGLRAGTIKIFSLRDSKNNPHCTIELREGKLAQVKGIKNGTILPKYRKACAAFIKNYLQQDLNSLSSSLLSFFLCVKIKDKALPATFFDATHLSHYLSGQRFSDTEALIKELVQAEADIFNYDVEETVKEVSKLIKSSGLIMHPERDVWVNEKEYKKIVKLLEYTKKQREAIPYQPLKLLERVYTPSQLRTWCLEYMKSLLVKKKYLAHKEDIFHLVDTIAISLDLTFSEFLYEFFTGQVETYKQATHSQVKEFWFDDIINEINNFNAHSVSFPQKKDVSASFEEGSSGCDECNGDELRKKAKSAGQDLENEVGEIQDELRQLEAFDGTLNDLMSEANSQIDNLTSELDYAVAEFIGNSLVTENKLHSVDLENNFVEYIKKAFIGKFPKIAEPFGSQVRYSYSGNYGWHIPTMTFDDFYNLVKKLEKRQEEANQKVSEIEDIFSDIQGCSCCRHDHSVEYSGFDLELFEAVTEKADNLTSLLSKVGNLETKIESLCKTFLKDLTEETPVTKLFSE